MGCARAFKLQAGNSSPFVSWNNLLKYNTLQEDVVTWEFVLDKITLILYYACEITFGGAQK